MNESLVIVTKFENKLAETLKELTEISLGKYLTNIDTALAEEVLPLKQIQQYMAAFRISPDDDPRYLSHILDMQLNQAFTTLASINNAKLAANAKYFSGHMLDSKPDICHYIFKATYKDCFQVFCRMELYGELGLGWRFLVQEQRLVVRDEND